MDHIELTALAKLLMEYESEEAQKTFATITRNLPHAPKKPKAEKKAAVSKKATGDTIYGITLPEKGSLDAKQFLQDGLKVDGKIVIHGMRNAGMRQFKTRALDGSDLMVMRIDPSQVRNDQCKAIAAYLGYDLKGNFGAQEQAARAQAAREMGYARTNGYTRSEQRNAFNRSLINGSQKVAKDTGLADQHQKRLVHLTGQEVSLVGQSLDLEKLVNNVELTMEERALALELQVMAEEKLKHVRHQLVEIANGAVYVPAVE